MTANDRSIRSAALPRRRAPRWEALLQDVRFGLRTLRRSGGYTIAAVGVLALGIGANTAAFSVIHGVLLAPLPFRHGEQLMLSLPRCRDGGKKPLLDSARFHRRP